MAKNIILIIGINYKNYKSYLKSSILIRCRPAILWMLNFLEINLEDNLIIFIEQKNKSIIDLLKKYQIKQPNLLLIQLKTSLNEKNALKYIINFKEKINVSLPTYLVLGNNIILNNNIHEENVIYTSKHGNFKKSFGFIENKNSRIIKKFLTENNNLKNNQIIMGKFFFSSNELLFESIEHSLSCRNSSLINFLNYYNSKIPLKIKEIQEYFDFEDFDSIIKFSSELFNVRNFNQIKVYKNNIIEKSSKNKVKIKQEEKWYKSLPYELQGVCPRIINSYEDKDKFYLNIEMYGYPTLSELFVYGNKNFEEWSYIIYRLMETYILFQQFKALSNKEYLTEIYKNKTLSRLSLMEKDEFWKNLLNQNKITINGKEYKNYQAIRKKINDGIEMLIAGYADHFSVVHGDLCFSNILLDSMNYCFKFIDPRGNVYGDARYDMAKLRHSIIGLYDFIVLDEYKLEKIDNLNYNLTIFIHQNNEDFSIYFDKLLEKYGFKVTEIAFIEALLFLTMIPLHSDKPNRQKAFYLTAIKKFNEIL